MIAPFAGPAAHHEAVLRAMRVGNSPAVVVALNNSSGSHRAVVLHETIGSALRSLHVADRTHAMRSRRAMVRIVTRSNRGTVSRHATDSFLASVSSQARHSNRGSVSTHATRSNHVTVATHGQVVTVGSSHTTCSNRVTLSHPCPLRGARETGAGHSFPVMG